MEPFRFHLNTLPTQNSGNSNSNLTEKEPAVGTNGLERREVFGDASNAAQECPRKNNNDLPTIKATNKRPGQWLSNWNLVPKKLGDGTNAVQNFNDSYFPLTNPNFDLRLSRLIGNKNIKDKRAAKTLEKELIKEDKASKENSRATNRNLFGASSALSLSSFTRIDCDLPENDSTEFDLELEKLHKNTDCDRLDKETAISIAKLLFKELSYEEFQLYGSFARSLIDNDQQKDDFGDIDIVTSLPLDRAVERLSSVLKKAGIPFDNSKRSCDFIIMWGDKQYLIQIIDKEGSRQAFPNKNLNPATGKLNEYEKVTYSGADLYCVPTEYHTKA